jgi:predicted DNA-binding protein with PD1-like motif
MESLPLRLSPGVDLRRSLEELAHGKSFSGAFVIAGIGSLSQARLRFANAPAEAEMEGPLEILAIGGTITLDGAHLHIAVADEHGRVQGGHVGYGNIVRTTAELLLLRVPGWQLSRGLDPRTGYNELKVHKREA